MLVIYYIYTLIVMDSVYSDLQEVVDKRIGQLRSKSERLYGKDGNFKPELWEMEMDDPLPYPRGNKQKLALISQQWLRYYECSSQLLASLTKHGTLPSKIVAAFEGAVARITCGLCVAPDETSSIKWMYAKATNETFTSLKPKSTTVKKQNGDLTLYLVRKQDSGVYRCHIGKMRGEMVVLEVLDENYRLVKPKTSQGPYSEPAVIINKYLMLHNAWSLWSECNRCDAVGRRRRYGMCYISVWPMIQNQTISSINKTTISNNTLLDDSLDAFIAFPTGIPCRSIHLHESIRKLDAVQRRPNEIMLGLCRKPCKDLVFNLNLSFRGLERENNTLELSLPQPLPPQPPPPPAIFVVVEKGKPIVLRCKGTNLRDVPYTWRIGSKQFIPRVSNEETNGRVYLNARDHLVFTRVEYTDTNLYSCWQSDALCSSIKLKVECGVEQHWRRYAIALTAIVIAAIILRILILLE